MKYTAIMIIATSARPIAAALMEVETASEPSCAPTILSLNFSSESLRAPIRILEASLSASVRFPIPVITASPFVITTDTLGTDIKLPS